MTKPQAAEALSLLPVEEKPVEAKREKPRLTVVPNPDSPPEIGEVYKLYQGQAARECWLCQRIAGDIAGNKKVSEDDAWHFTSCVLSWENLNDLS